MGVRDYTLNDLARDGVRRGGDRTALVAGPERLTFRDVAERADRLASGLARAGLGPGDRVALIAQNRPEHLLLLLAAARLGAILVPVNWRLGPEEMRHALADAAPRVGVAEGAYASLAGEGEGTAWFGLDVEGPGLRPFAELRDAGEAPEAAPDADRPVLLIHTAAVDGRPRGALLSHRNLLAGSGTVAGAFGLGPGDVGMVLLPLFHIAGLVQALAVFELGGASLVPPRFEPGDAAALIGAEAVTTFFAFAPMLGQILDAAAERAADLASLRAVWGLDAPATIARFEEACPGARFFVGFGQSESSGLVTLSPSRERPGSAGRPAPGVALAVLDEDDREVAAGTVGEIALRGPAVFAGYWNLPEETAWTFRGGWHHTGDLGRVDPDGYLHYAGRSPAKELIKSGGENVYPAEVERALREHPAVREAVVFGVPDERWGEAVRAVCVLRPGEAAEPADLIAFVGARIARFKRPKEVVLVPDLPRTEAGALDRARVKAEHGG